MERPKTLKAFLDDVFEKAGGSLPFEQFMQLALYDPQYGYYATNISDVGGSRGDFSTWATLSDLGKPLAAWIKGEMVYHHWPVKELSLIEIGGGDGSLAEAILKCFGWPGRRHVNYHIVEISEPLRDRQARRLKGKGVKWHPAIGDALTACGGNAIIFSNELVDAFPARWLRWNGGTWEEIFVKYSSEGGLGEEFRPCDPAPGLVDPPAGQRVEIHDSYYRWLDAWLPDFRKGSILTIDYGGTSLNEIYARRLNGTMRGYFRQERIEGGGVYQRFGRQDLTCDVDFSRLVAHGRENDLEFVRLEDQHDFMNRWVGGQLQTSQAARAFQVLHQRRI